VLLGQDNGLGDTTVTTDGPYKALTVHNNSLVSFFVTVFNLLLIFFLAFKKIKFGTL